MKLVKTKQLSRAGAPGIINASIAIKVVFSSYVALPLDEKFLVFQILKHTATTHKSANVFCSNVIG